MTQVARINSLVTGRNLGGGGFLLMADKAEKKKEKEERNRHMHIFCSA